MKNTALITGASGGIGAEFARYHAAKGGDLVLVARREGALHKLKSELEAAHHIRVVVIPIDLSRPDSAEAVFQATEDANIQVDILINNAGFGGHGKFYEYSLQKYSDMMQVNMISLVNLTHRYLQGMVARNSGKILHVASIAAFLPGPLQAVYYATKSFVSSFSQAITQELSGSGVTCTLLCPGPVTTNFVKAGNLEGVSVWENAATPESVAKCGYEAMMKGRLMAIDNPMLSLMVNWFLPFFPRKLVLKVSQKSMEKK